jgi:hypothetical protein
MNEFFNEIKKDKVMSGGFILTFIIVIISLVYILISFGSLPPYIPLFNQLPWGDQRLGTTIMIFIPLAVALFIVILNTFICYSIYKKSQIISRMLTIANVLITFLSFLFILRTTNLIT